MHSKANRHQADEGRAQYAQAKPPLGHGQHAHTLARGGGIDRISTLDHDANHPAPRVDRSNHKSQPVTNTRRACPTALKRLRFMFAL